MISQLEAADQQLRETGVCMEWFANSDEVTRSVSASVNGHLFHELLKASRHTDLACAELFRVGQLLIGSSRCVIAVSWITFVSGASILGELPRSGVGKPTECDLVRDVAGLQRSCSLSNTALLRELREDEHAAELLRLTQKDADLGRMSVPVPISSCNVDGLLLHPRFGVEQCKPDGSTKIRAVDNLSWAAMGPESGTSRCKKARKLMSVNGHTVPAEKMHHDTIDDLAVAMSKLRRGGATLGEILRAGDWRSPAFLQYLNAEQLDLDRIAEAHDLVSSDDDDVCAQR